MQGRECLYYSRVEELVRVRLVHFELRTRITHPLDQVSQLLPTYTVLTLTPHLFDLRILNQHGNRKAAPPTDLRSGKHQLRIPSVVTLSPGLEFSGCILNSRGISAFGAIARINLTTCFCGSSAISVVLSRLDRFV